MSNQPPIEVPQGAIRLNTDSQKLEFFAQDRWYEFATDSPTLDGGARGFNGWWNSSRNTNVNRFYNYINSRVMQLILVMQQIQLRETGGWCGCASRTRGV